jgi:N-acetylmuramoyl-L-alanine amidase
MAECGFISNPEEAEKLEQPEYRSQVAFSLMCGLNDFCAETGRINEKTS